MAFRVLWRRACISCMCFFFQAEDGIRDVAVTGVQTCALPIFFALQSFGLVWYYYYKPCPTKRKHPKSDERELRELRRLSSYVRLLSPRTFPAEIGRACVGKECRSRWSPYH